MWEKIALLGLLVSIHVHQAPTSLILFSQPVINVLKAFIVTEHRLLTLPLTNVPKVIIVRLEHNLQHSILVKQVLTMIIMAQRAAASAFSPHQATFWLLLAI